MKAYYGEETYNSFTANEQQVMAYVWNGDSVSNMELQQMLGMNSLEIGKLLHNMVDKNLLNQESGQPLYNQVIKLLDKSKILQTSHKYNGELERIKIFSRFTFFVLMTDWG